MRPHLRRRLGMRMKISSPTNQSARPAPTPSRRPLGRVFTEAEIMAIFTRVILSRHGCVLCPEYEVWIEKKTAVEADGGAVRHEYGYETGRSYC